MGIVRMLPQAEPRQFILKELCCSLRPLTAEDLPGLMRLKAKEAMHMERLLRQRSGKAYYLGAFIHTHVVGQCLLSLEDKSDVHPHTNGQFCADLVDLLVLDVLRGLHRVDRLCGRPVPEDGHPVSRPGCRAGVPGLPSLQPMWVPERG